MGPPSPLLALPQDGVMQEFEGWLDYAAFSVRVAEADVPRLALILRAIPQERVRAMQVSVARSAGTHGPPLAPELRSFARPHSLTMTDKRRVGRCSRSECARFARGFVTTACCACLTRGRWTLVCGPLSAYDARVVLSLSLSLSCGCRRRFEGVND